MSIRARLVDALDRAAEIERELSSTEGARAPARLAELGREHHRLTPVVELGRQYLKVEDDLSQARELSSADDAELAEEAQREVDELESTLADLQQRLRPLLVPHDPLDDRDAIVEIRAGTGGDEAALFAADLLRMYERYIDQRGWRLELISRSEGVLGGIKEAVFKVRGDGAFGAMRFESGVHRVQRVPATEAQGRIHTSAATVAVLPEAEEIDVRIDDKDLRIDVFRASGPGGQGVNTTDSAVRITHVPTGVVVSQQDQRSQLQNRMKAMEVLRARLLDLRIAEQEAERSRMRKTQVGTGDRSAKIRTYNFPQNRVTDHRINFTVHDLDRILEGELHPLVEALGAAQLEERLQEA
ncbi:MAG TPA: peptide chain release factor 1 [Gemmatimonadaceae bacterium]|nr:peptide chain release factor 1 [Gemmatimonadaceae bacterium]